MLKKRKYNSIDLLTCINLLNTSIQSFDLLDKRNKSIHHKGDFNVNLLNIDADQLTADFYQTLISYSPIPTIIKPTRITHYTATTLIDNIFTNDYSHNYWPGLLFSDITDTYQYFLKPNCAPKK